MGIVNESQLRHMVKEIVEREFGQKYRIELDKIWGYLNELREEIITLKKK